MEPDQASPVLNQKCTIWKYGIKWTTTSSVDAVVEVNDKRVLRCTEEEELALVNVRSRVINEVLSVKAEFVAMRKHLRNVSSNPITQS